MLGYAHSTYILTTMQHYLSFLEANVKQKLLAQFTKTKSDANAIAYILPLPKQIYLSECHPFIRKFDPHPFVRVISKRDKIESELNALMIY